MTRKPSRGELLSCLEPSTESPQGLCLDKGYDFPEVYELAAEFGFTAHVRARGEEAQALKREAGFRARRWVVERTQSGSIASGASSSAGRNGPTPTSPCSTSPAL